jgi:hypothetical protein
LRRPAALESNRLGFDALQIVFEFGQFAGSLFDQRLDLKVLDEPLGPPQALGRPRQKNPPGQKQEEPNREELERALNEMKSSPNFTGKGINAEIIDTVNGLTVRLNQANGSTIKTMTADEFMRLRRSSVLEDVGRGNILDQKF